jgi:integrase/recombinase XerD
MVLRVEQGKGQVDHYVMLSPRLLEILRAYLRPGRPRHWLFPGRFPDQSIYPATIRHQRCLSRRIRCDTRSRPIFSSGEIRTRSLLEVA